MSKNDPEGDPLAQSVDALSLATRCAENYLSNLQTRNVAPTRKALQDLAQFDEALPEGPSEPAQTLALLDRLGSPATVASAAGRFYGLVVGGALPAALGARVLSSAWDQVVFSDATSPVGIKLEAVAAGWIREILGLPANASSGFVTGTTMGTFLCLAAARHELLEKQGWDVEQQGLFGAPRINVVASEQIHVTVKKALAMLGLGSANIEAVPCDHNGSVLVEKMPPLTDTSLVLTQAGNVNSGACDDIGAICEIANAAGAWVHVDGAFGLWAAASRRHRHLLNGFQNADSWVTDAHKWLNTPYDCGIAICRKPAAIHAAMATVAPYLKTGGEVAPKDMVPEFSRSARGVEVWAALRSLGARGVEALVERCCDQAARMATGLAALGFTILNDVVLNQVVATLEGSEHRMSNLADSVQNSGEAWFGATVWNGNPAIRLSFSSWVTSGSDVDETLLAIEKSARQLGLI